MAKAEKIGVLDLSLESPSGFQSFHSGEVFKRMSYKEKHSLNIILEMLGQRSSYYHANYT